MFDTLVKIANNPKASPNYFIRLIEKIRPGRFENKSSAVKRFKSMVDTLERNTQLKDGFREYMHHTFTGKRLTSVITETGIIKDSGFFSELSRRIAHKILPEQPSEDSLYYLLNNAFYRVDDKDWIEAIEVSVWKRFFEIIDFKPLTERPNNDFTIVQIQNAIQILALRITGLGVNQNLLRMVPLYDNRESPFISLMKEVNQLIENLKDENYSRHISNPDIRQIYVLISQCEEYADQIIKNREIYGINFKTTVKVSQLKEELLRLKNTLDFFTIFDNAGKYDQVIRFMKEMIKVNATKNKITYFLYYSTGLIAYQITQHSGKSGEKYITKTRKEYYKMLYSAGGGGLIVAFLCLFKVLYSYWDVSPFGHAFLYSMNYAAGFILLYLLGFTLATKQPAMTAATLAQSIDPKNNPTGDYSVFSELFTRLFRSQFIAFVGNVAVAFPVALGIGLLYQWYYGENPIKPYKADSLLIEQNPFLSLALFHAAIAGFYLFLSGLISGYYINRNIHNRISYRLKRHPVLRAVFPGKWLNSVARFYDKKIGGISGNFWFGIFLGSTGTIGAFMGLPIDIRHITFAAGNFALALVGLNFKVGLWDILACVLGIGLMGFMNFIVSFTLSLFLAMRSRRIHIRELLAITKAVFLEFKKDKSAFIFPPKVSENLPLEIEKESRI